MKPLIICIPVGASVKRHYSAGSLVLIKQEAQLMLTNLRDAFIGQSRSPNIVPFYVLDIVSIVQ